MAPIRIILGIICTAFISSLAEPVSDHLKQTSSAKLLAVARQEIGVRELTGNNDGKRVAAYLAYTGQQNGAPWCAAFISWVYREAGYKQPKTAWSPDLFPQVRKTAKPLEGDLYGIYFPDLHRIAHAGIVEARKNDWITGIEGNTNVTGSREGDGVYRRRRHVKTIKAFARWLPADTGRAKP